MFTMKLSFFAVIISYAVPRSLHCEAFAPQHDIHRTQVIEHKATLLTRHAFFGFGVDEKSSTTRIASPDANVLIKKAEDILNNKSGFYSQYDSDVFAEDFVFRGPYVGPLNKKDYLDTMDAFGIYKAFPDIKSNAWGFSVDPKDPNRVWFMVRNSGTFNGEPILRDTLNLKPNGAELEGCPETFSIIFDNEQKVKYFSVGYVADRFEGNTDGKGAAVGIFHAIGFPFPKVGPLLKFLQFFGSEIIKQPPLSYSIDVPEWWTDERKSSEGYL